MNCLQSGRKLDFTRNNKKGSKRLIKPKKVTYKCKTGIICNDKKGSEMLHVTMKKEVICYM